LATTEPADPGLPRDAWQARVTSGRGRFPTLTGAHGTLSLEGGRLSFAVEQTPHPLWSVRAQAVSASMLGFFASSDLVLESPETGTVHVTVSRERISRLWASESRERRQRQYAEEFLAALALSGATVKR
jgi:hypothetical protein